MTPATLVAGIRVVRAALLSLLAAIFAQAYGAFLFNRYAMGASLSEGALPMPCHFFLRYAALGYVLPAATLAIGLWLLRRKGADSPSLEVLLSASYVGSALWAAACVLAWFLPGYIPHVEIR
jgi:hypothetical protein